VRTAVIWVKDVRLIGIADPCNGLDIYVLYISFLFCFPGSLRRRGVFLLVGIPYIYIINTIRGALLAWLSMYHKDLVDVSHHYIFTASVYLLVFYLWVLYSKKEAKGELFMVASLIVILILSWLNVDLFGHYHRNKYSMYINQGAHIVAVSLTGAIGYFNWRYKEKWLSNLWLYTYCAILLIMLTFSVVYFLNLNINKDWRAVIIGLRNTFTGPLPFLIFYLFSRVSGSITSREQAKENT
jgi:exosortase/archaeosortase family protein